MYEDTARTKKKKVSFLGGGHETIASLCYVFVFVFFFFFFFFFENLVVLIILYLTTLGYDPTGVEGRLWGEKVGEKKRKRQDEPQIPFLKKKYDKKQHVSAGWGL